MTGASAFFLNEDDWSLWQACNDTDQGGQAQGADPLPAQGQNGHANAVRRRKKRQAKAFERVYAHVEDERIKELLDALPMDDRRRAEAWALLISQCKPDEDDLANMTIRSEWQNATIEKDIGYSVNTITL